MFFVFYHCFTKKQKYRLPVPSSYINLKIMIIENYFLNKTKIYDKCIKYSCIH